MPEVFFLLFLHVYDSLLERSFFFASLVIDIGTRNHMIGERLNYLSVRITAFPPFP